MPEYVKRKKREKLVQAHGACVDGAWDGVGSKNVYLKRQKWNIEDY